MTCAFAVRGAFKKLSGVESVDVSLNKGIASAKLKPGNALTVEQFWRTVRKNGFTPKETNVVIRGEVVQRGTAVQLKMPGTDRAYELAASPKASKALEEVKGQAGKTVTIEGTLVPSKDPAARVPIQVRASRL